MDSIERITQTRDRAPQPQPARSESDRDALRVVATSEPRTQPPRANPVEARNFQARLNYDPDAEKVVVEILDPVTGDVLRRLPAEDAANRQKELRTGGRLLDRVA